MSNLGQYAPRERKTISSVIPGRALARNNHSVILCSAVAMDCGFAAVVRRRRKWRYGTRCRTATPASTPAYPFAATSSQRAR